MQLDLVQLFHWGVSQGFLRLATKHSGPSGPETAVDHKAIDDQTGHIYSVPQIIHEVVGHEHVPRLFHAGPQHPTVQLDFLCVLLGEINEGHPTIMCCWMKR